MLLSVAMALPCALIGQRQIYGQEPVSGLPDRRDDWQVCIAWSFSDARTAGLKRQLEAMRPANRQQLSRIILDGLP